MDDDETQQFSLRWHNHQIHRGPCYLKIHYTHSGHDNTDVPNASDLPQSSVVGALGHMLRSGALSDVTLCAAGASLRAHRVVLAACSQYFAQIFKDVECDAGGPLVVVAGCGAAELRLLLTFMYTGEVTAARARLPALLALARTLRVSGLTDTTENTLINSELEPLNLEKSEPEPGYLSETTAGSDRDTASRLDQPECVSETVAGSDRDGLSRLQPGCVSETAAGSDRDRLSRLQPGCVSETAAGSDRDRLSRLDQIVQNLYSTHKLAMTPLAGLETADKRDSTCGVCGKRLSNQYNLRVHMDTHAGRRHACRACPHVSRSRDALRKHVAYRHAQARHDHAGYGHARAQRDSGRNKHTPLDSHNTQTNAHDTHTKSHNIDRNMHNTLTATHSTHDLQTDTHKTNDAHANGHTSSLSRDRF